MATKQLYATGTFKYKNRMLKAGDPVEMDGPTARLYEHLQKVTFVRPRAASVVVPTTKQVLEAKVVVPKRRRRKAKKPA